MIEEGMPIRRTYGGTEVTVLVDGIWSTAKDTIVHLAGDHARREILDRLPDQPLAAPVNCFLLSGPPGLVLIDAGAGTEWGEHFGAARGRLRQLGVDPKDVAHVVITHIHLDHAAGLFDGDERYFPEATIHTPAADLRFFTDAVAKEATAPAKRGGFELAERLMRIYGDRVKATEPGPVLSEIEMVPLPGHTPGHSGFLVGAKTDRALTVGDVFHFADLQAADPDVGVPYDTAPEQAAASRRAALAEAARRRWDICGGHVDGFRSVSAAGDSYVLGHRSIR